MNEKRQKFLDAVRAVNEEAADILGKWMEGKDLPKNRNGPRLSFEWEAVDKPCQAHTLPSEILSGLFIWSYSPQGEDYWREVALMLEKKERVLD